MRAESRGRTAMKRSVYRTGLLPTYHRARNRSTLTVVMFHRVLAPTDPRWQQADPVWTMSETLFGECLDFFREHYRVVSLDEVLQGCEKCDLLPERSLLITIDDGWADTADYAAAQLKRRSLPATAFVIAGAVGREDGMLSLQQLISLRSAGIRVGAHGVSHEPIPRAFDAARELYQSRELLRQTLGEPPATLSFPHGVYDDAAVALARRAGYRLLFTSDPFLNRLPTGGRRWGTVGRIHIPASEVSDDDGRLRPELLALWLFRRPVVEPEAMQ